MGTAGASKPPSLRRLAALNREYARRPQFQVFFATRHHALQIFTSSHFLHSFAGARHCAAAYNYLVCYKKLVAAHRAAPHCAAAYHFLVCCKTGGRAASSAEWCWSMLLLGLLHNRRALRGSSQDLLSSFLKNIEIFLPK